MSYLYRIPVVVKNMNPLAGGFTAGLSMMSLHGLCSAMELKLGIEIEQFAFVVSKYVEKLNEQLKQSMDQMPVGKQADSPPMSAERHADMEGALYIRVAGFVDKSELAQTIMSLRVQGGAVMNYLDDSDIQLLDLDDAFDEDSEIKAFIYRQERAKLSVLYKKLDIDYSVQTHNSIAERLAQGDTVMMCTGFAVHDQKLTLSGDLVKVAEPILTLVQAQRVYELKNEESFVASNYFFSFNKLAYEQDARILTLQ